MIQEELQLNKLDYQINNIMEDKKHFPYILFIMMIMKKKKSINLF